MTAWVLRLHVQPGAKRAAVLGLHGDALKLAVTSPPVDGAANAAVCALLATELGIPARQVTLVGGETSRRKRVRIETDILPEAWRHALVSSPSSDR